MTVNINSDQSLRDLLTQAQTIAVVGHSDKPSRTSYQIAQFLRQQGYRVFPVNPMVSTIDGQPSYASLAEIPDKVDIVNVFRQSDHLPQIVDEAIAIHAPTVWAQLGITHPQAIATAQQAGLTIITDTCIKVEYLRLGVKKQH
jgi:predicted CoA-binding protein